MSHTEDEFLSTPAVIFLVALAGAICFGLFWVVLNGNHGYNKEAYIEKVKQNLFQGEVLGLIYQAPETTIVKNDRLGGAVVAGTLAACAGFGPIGIGVGALIGAGSDEESTQINCRRLWLLVKSGQDTFRFEIVMGGPQNEGYLFQTADRTIFAKSVPPDRHWFIDSLKIGDKLRVPSSIPLGMISKDMRFYSVFLYRENEKIPHIDD